MESMIALMVLTKTLAVSNVVTIFLEKHIHQHYYNHRSSLPS